MHLLMQDIGSRSEWQNVEANFSFEGSFSELMHQPASFLTNQIDMHDGLRNYALHWHLKRGNELVGLGGLHMKRLSG